MLNCIKVKWMRQETIMKSGRKFTKSRETEDVFISKKQIAMEGAINEGDELNTSKAKCKHTQSITQINSARRRFAMIDWTLLKMRFFLRAPIALSFLFFPFSREQNALNYFCSPIAFPLEGVVAIPSIRLAYRFAHDELLFHECCWEIPNYWLSKSYRTDRYRFSLIIYWTFISWIESIIQFTKPFN